MSLTVVARAGWACLVLLAISSTATSHEQQETGGIEVHPRLAVLVPIYNSGADIEHLPTRCSSSGRLSSQDARVELVLFRALRDGDEPSGRAVVSEVSENARRCFARVRTLYHRIDEEEISPRAMASSSSSSSPSPSELSEMLFSAFLDPQVRSQLSGYEALAVFPSLPGGEDNLVGDNAASIPVAWLRDEAFYPPALHEQDLSAGDVGKIWVKTLIGVEGAEDVTKKLRGGKSSSKNGGFSQSTGGVREGNAPDAAAVIYNNSDPEFVSYIRAASARQQQTGEFHLFDEMLSYALKDPLHEKYTSKFVTADLTSLEGGERGVITAIDVRKLSHKKAKRSGKNNVADHKPIYTKWMSDEKWKHSEKYKTLEKWRGDEANGMEPKWMSEEKWKGDEKNGVEPKWKTNRCLADCTHTNRDGTKGRVCDISCESGMPYGTLGCSAKGGKHGLLCRLCYNDVTKALKHDTPDDRAIMCDTMAPPSSYSYSKLNLGGATGDDPREGGGGVTRKLKGPKRRRNAHDRDDKPSV